MKIKVAARHISYRTLFHTILILAFLLPFVFILTALVTLEGVNKCSSFGTLLLSLLTIYHFPFFYPFLYHFNLQIYIWSISFYYRFVFLCLSLTRMDLDLVSFSLCSYAYVLGVVVLGTGEMKLVLGFYWKWTWIFGVWCVLNLLIYISCCGLFLQFIWYWRFECFLILQDLKWRKE